jgi:hypothetical protein
MFWDIFTIVLIVLTLVLAREARLLAARYTLYKWRRFSFR